MKEGKIVDETTGAKTSVESEEQMTGIKIKDLGKQKTCKQIEEKPKLEKNDLYGPARNT